MITNSFHKNINIIGINIEKTMGNVFIISIAYKDNGRWSVKTLSGFSGDIDNDLLFKKVIDNGNYLDKESAELMFSNAKIDFGEYK